MGNESNDKPIFVSWDHGAAVPIGEVSSITLDPVENFETDEENVIALKEQDFSCSFVIRLPRMSRKRLVKVLMSHGESRNCAEGMARTWGGHYGLNYFRYMFCGKACSVMTPVYSHG